MQLSHLHVRDLVGNLVGASDVFRKFEIDFYRIGGLELHEAAARQHLPLEDIETALACLPPNPSPPPTSTMGLITYIDTRYHAVHRTHLLSAIRLAKAIEVNEKNDTAANQPCPSGLTNLLTLLFDTLEDHQEGEAENLYPALINSPQHSLRYPVCRAMVEHDEISEQLDTLARLTNGYLPPEDAGLRQRILYKLCSVLDGDVRLHMHLENNLLFPPFAGDVAIAS